MRKISAFFEPRSVAVVGSLKEGWGGAYGVMKNMRHFGWTGAIYPINPTYSEVMGIRAYTTVDEVTDPIDLAVVITPPATVPGIIEQCARKGVKAVIIASEGFAEAGEAGAKLQQQAVHIASRSGMRLIGPNTIGVANTRNGLVTNPYAIGYQRFQKGNIAYVSQSGVFGVQARPLEKMADPISKMCDLGNKCDVDEVDMLDYLGDDPETEVVAIHMEDVKDGRRFIDIARKVVARKPVLVLKPGRTAPGARAAASHTGSLTGDEQVYENVFKQVGAIQVSTVQEFWELPKVFALQPLPEGNRIAIITTAGGVGVMATDVAVDCGLSMARLSKATVERLGRSFPRPPGNPIDFGPAAVLATDPTALREETISAVLDDPNVDCAIVILYAGLAYSVQATANIFERLGKRISKPVTIWFYGPDASLMEELSRQLESVGFPTYSELETAVKALGIAAEYSRVKARAAGGLE